MEANIDEVIGKEEQLGQEFTWLIAVSARKRDFLEKKYKKTTKIQKIVGLTSSIITFLSLLMLASLIVNLINNNIIQIISLVMATVGSIAMIINNLSYSANELVSLITGSSDFLKLREDAINCSLDNSLSYDLRFTRLKKLKDDYVQLSTIYDRYVKVGERFDSYMYDIGASIASKQIGENKYKARNENLVKNFKEELN